MSLTSPTTPVYRASPFLVLHRDGRSVARAVGLQPKHVLEEALGLAATDAAT